MSIINYHCYFFLSGSDLHKIFNDKDSKRWIQDKNQEIQYLDIELDLSEYFHVECCNVLILGKPGFGKSSVINTMISMQGEYYKNVAAVATQDVSFTRHILGYQINLNKNLIFKDSFGFENGNYKAILELLLDGQLGDGHEIDKPIQKNQIHNNNINDKIHVVVLVMDSTNLDKKSVMNEYAEFAQDLTKKGFLLLFLIFNVLMFMFLS